MKLIYKYFFLILVTISIANDVLANQTAKDSLLNILKGETDSLKAETYSNLGNKNYTKGNFNKCIEYFKKATIYFSRENNLKSTIYSLNLIGHSYIKQGEYNKALKNYAWTWSGMK